LIDQPNNKVLLVSHNSNLSGAPISLAQLARYLPSFGFSPLYLLPKPGPLEKMLKSWRINYKILKRFNAVFDYICIIKRENPALIHVNSLVKTWPVLVSRLLKKPVIWHVREYLGNKKIYAKLIHLLSDCVVLISQEQFRLFNGMKKAVRIPNGVDITQFENVQPVNILPKDTNARTIVTYLGSIELRKGLIILAKAAELLKNSPWIHYAVVGDVQKGHEKYKKEIINFLNEKGLYSRFHFLGYRSDIPDILAITDVLCHPAFIEVFGRVVIEAMASGLPVIASKVGEMPKIVDDGRSGILISPGDYKALAKAIELIDSNKVLKQKMGMFGYKKVKREFSIEIHTQRIAQLYNKLLHERNC